MTPPIHQLERPRDPRVDVARGAALLAIYSGHIAGNRAAELLPSRLGLSDMAEVFVFLSGYAGALAAARRLAAGGTLALLGRSLLRGGRLYLAYVLTAVALLLLAERLGLRILPPGRSANVSELLALRLPLGHLNILLLYLILAMLLPPLALTARRWPGVAMTLSLGVYAAVQFAPDWLALPVRWRESLYFNPLAWQVLFCGGACAAFTAQTRGRRWLDSAATVAAAWVVLAALLGWTLLANGAALPATEKGTLGGVRLLHFVCLVIVVRAALPVEHPVWTSRRLSALRLSGRHPLAVYCSGAGLSIVASAALRDAGASWWMLAAVNVAGWTACCAVAAAAEQVRRRITRRTVSSPGPDGRSRTAPDAAVPPESPPTPPAAVPAG